MSRSDRDWPEGFVLLSSVRIESTGDLESRIYKYLIILRSRVVVVVRAEKLVYCSGHKFVTFVCQFDILLLPIVRRDALERSARDSQRGPGTN